MPYNWLLFSLNLKPVMQLGCQIYGIHEEKIRFFVLFSESKLLQIMKISLQQFIYIGPYINDKFYIVSVELICLVEENNTYFVSEKPDFWSRHQISSFNLTPLLIVGQITVLGVDIRKCCTRNCIERQPVLKNRKYQTC